MLQLRPLLRMGAIVNIDELGWITHEIYDLTAGREEWHTILDRIARVCDVEAASFASGTRSQDLSILCNRTDPELLTEYARDWLPMDPAMPALFRSRPGEVLSLEDVGGQSAYRNTEVCSNFWTRTEQSPEHLRCKLHQDANSWLVFAVNARRRDNEILNHSAKLFNFFVPHLTRAAELQRRLRSALVDRSLAGLPSGAPGALLIGEDESVLYFDERSEDILEAAHGVTLRKGRLWFDNPRDGEIFRGLVWSCANIAPGSPKPGGRVTLAGKRGIQLEVLPYSGMQAPVGLEFLPMSRATALVLIDDPELRFQTCLTRLRTKYGLTRTEAEVALQAVTARSRGELASQMGITESTVKTHLSRIYEKTDTKRHANLVQLITNEILGAGHNI